MFSALRLHYEISNSQAKINLRGWYFYSNEITAKSLLPQHSCGECCASSLACGVLCVCVCVENGVCLSLIRLFLVHLYVNHVSFSLSLLKDGVLVFLAYSYWYVLSLLLMPHWLY